jgi:hypothetical protein
MPINFVIVWYEKGRPMYKHVKIHDNPNTQRREYYNQREELIAYEPASAIKDWGKHVPIQPSKIRFHHP